MSGWLGHGHRLHHPRGGHTSDLWCTLGRAMRTTGIIVFGMQLRPRNHEDRLDSQNRRETGNNQVVRKFLAVAILVVFASLNAIDGICCPDGCTHERESTPQQHADHAGDGSCMLCLGGIDSTGAPELTPSGMLTTRIGHARLRSHVDALANPPDHPPRA